MTADHVSFFSAIPGWGQKDVIIPCSRWQLQVCILPAPLLRSNKAQWKLKVWSN